MLRKSLAVPLVVLSLVAVSATPPPARTYDTVIARDRFGVPHVFGRTDPDVTYAHAEDDFATLQEAVAMARGRLGAMTGDRPLPRFVAHRTKPVLFRPADLKRNLERVYRP